MRHFKGFVYISIYNNYVTEVIRFYFHSCIVAIYVAIAIRICIA